DCRTRFEQLGHHERADAQRDCPRQQKQARLQPSGRFHFARLKVKGRILVQSAVMPYGVTTKNAPTGVNPWGVAFEASAFRGRVAYTTKPVKWLKRLESTWLEDPFGPCRRRTIRADFLPANGDRRQRFPCSGRKGLYRQLRG